MKVEQAPARVTGAAAQPAQGPDCTADVDAALDALVRLLARQAAREYLERQANPDAGDTTMTPDRQRRLPKLHRIDDAADILDVSSRTVRRLIAARELAACRLGRSVRVHPDDLAAYIDRRRGR